jgi:hypothetical protein
MVGTPGRRAPRIQSVQGLGQWDSSLRGWCERAIISAATCSPHLGLHPPLSICWVSILRLLVAARSQKQFSKHHISLAGPIIGAGAGWQSPKDTEALNQCDCYTGLTADSFRNH